MNFIFFKLFLWGPCGCRKLYSFYVTLPQKTNITFIKKNMGIHIFTCSLIYILPLCVPSPPRLSSVREQWICAPSWIYALGDQVDLIGKWICAPGWNCTSGGQVDLIGQSGPDRPKWHLLQRAHPWPSLICTLRESQPEAFEIRYQSIYIDIGVPLCIRVPLYI